MMMFPTWILHRVLRARGRSPTIPKAPPFPLPLLQWGVSPVEGLLQWRGLWLSSPLSARTHYQTLGIGAACSQAEIKRAYYDLSMRFHPDKGGSGDEDKFREITTAYEVLGNPRLRRLYDRGLLTDDQPDASVHYPTQAGGGEGPFGDQFREETKASVKTFDKWAQQHYSHAFNRSQSERATKRNVEVKRMHNQSNRGEMSIILLFFLFIVIASVVMAPSHGGTTITKHNDTNNNNNSDRKKS